MRITKPFYLSKCEVTLGQFKQFVEATKYVTDAEKNGDGWPLTDGYWGPVRGVTWRASTHPQQDNYPVCVMEHMISAPQHAAHIAHLPSGLRQAILPAANEMNPHVPVRTSP
ncbi:MAG: SUMF1/EgtB/PvdO family nonheme iron enzyme [Pirellulales bacterium]|nr:SUMF1/EgtB/PvdO family nonheme iron enzyme [Pirellulales bacterium]